VTALRAEAMARRMAELRRPADRAFLLTLLVYPNMG
jgi:hypothetical protein